MRTKTVDLPCNPRNGIRARWVHPASVALTLASSACFEPSAGRDSNDVMDAGTTGETDASAGSLTSEPDDSAETSTSGSPGTGNGSETSPSSETSSASASDDTGEDAGAVCRPGEILGCDGDDLVQCNDEGNGELAIACALGCNDAELRCNDVDPSNGLGDYLDDAAFEDALDLGSQATINTSDGSVTVDGASVDVASVLVDSTPPIRVLVVQSLVAQDVTVSGTPALAIVSDGDVQISGHFSLSAVSGTPGPGALTNATCQGGDQVVAGTGGNTAAGGAGGGGFGTPGANGGTAIAQGHHAAGGSGGGSTGSATLDPLRGGCNSGVVGASLRGAGGGAVQLVSRTSIVVEGILSANGTSRSGGGSGGGILLEAPEVIVSGNVVANGGAGAGGGLVPVAGEHGRTDAQPAQGGPSNDVNMGEGGNGAAGNVGASAGQNVNYQSGLSTDLNFAGHGGGGAGRIRVNVPNDGLTLTGLFSPNHTTGTLAVR